MSRIVDPVLEDLRQTLLRMGSLSEAILAKSLRAVFERDAALAGEVKDDDLEIDRLDVHLDEAVTKALALQSPVAADLRSILAIRTIATDLERVGDLARNIAKSAMRLTERPAVPVSAQLQDLADQTTRALGESLDAFSETDAERARRVIEADDDIDEAEDLLIQRVIEGVADHPGQSAQEVDVILIAKNLERVGDHATNIAEEVIFLAEARIVRHESKLKNGSSKG